MIRGTDYVAVRGACCVAQSMAHRSAVNVTSMLQSVARPVAHGCGSSPPTPSNPSYGAMERERANKLNTAPPQTDLWHTVVLESRVARITCHGP